MAEPSDHKTSLEISRATAWAEIRRRVPWNLFAVAAGLVMVKVGHYFEEALAKKIEVVFFIPMIVYMSDCIGTETLALFVRELAMRKVSLRRLFWRETCVGVALGLATGLPMALVSYLWLQDARLSAALAVAMTLNGLVAVLTGMIAPVLFRKLHRDPAIGTDEITTAFSDNISMFIYLVIATLVLF